MSTLPDLFVQCTMPVLSHAWHLRPNRGGGLVYLFSHDDSQLVGLSAYETVAVTLCDGVTCWDEIEGLLCQALAVERAEAHQIIAGLLHKNVEKGPFLIPVSQAGESFTRVNAARVLRDLAA